MTSVPDSEDAMLNVHHLNCGTLHAPPSPRASCHCLLLEHETGLVLVDSGIGVQDCRRPEARIGREVIDAAGFHFDETDTAVGRLRALGFRADDVRHVVLTHADPDHAGGLADFPDAEVHVSAEEHANILGGNPRYAPAQFDHAPRWKLHGPAANPWFGLEARRLGLGFATEVLLVPLFGHTLGHCGVAVGLGDRWLLHVGDAYYLRAELADDGHPVSTLAAMRADDDVQRRASLQSLRRLAQEHPGRIEMLGYHDFGEFPPGAAID
ncbi:MBL fold metallo-hydrolase [Paludisphaera soli]|uniref:MBL fold metallo-hydrolase n=1 Tax=Paludisphaera soli TaxID=2712865 RepID=UPI00197FCFD7|nr:MBL fold metallo-hydrolase [Paludisphaera soli]